jgi:Sulfate permease and related transporters (MFS superfamily)
VAGRSNALILTAVIAQDYFPDQKAQLTEQRFALSSGFANVLLAPFGAMPMCHGAGGLAAYHGQGSTTGWSIAIFGVLCLVLALLFGNDATQVLTAIPMEVVVTLVLYAAWVLADPIKLSQLRPNCLCIILLMVPVTLISGLLTALAVGLMLEWLRLKRSGQASSGV